MRVTSPGPRFPAKSPIPGSISGAAPAQCPTEATPHLSTAFQLRERADFCNLGRGRLVRKSGGLMKRVVKRVAIVGGGPGGLFAARMLESTAADLCTTTIYEQGARLGGKVLTAQFGSAAVTYEAGVAELYDYSHLGSDPLRQTVEELGLATVPMAGSAIVGGISGLTDRLAARLSSALALNSRVVRVGRNGDGSYRVAARRDGATEERDFDFVLLALPNYWLERLEWGSRELRIAMQKHLAHYDRPAHYLRISILFKEPFWRAEIPGAYFLADSFGGCCVYDEGFRHPCAPFGVLGWLLTGNDAMTLSNCEDRELIDMALDSLPQSLKRGRALHLEGRVHRWIGTLNALPGGNPVHSLERRHRPDPENHPGLVLAGDYLFDSTLNGAFDSADYATDVILSALRQEAYRGQIETEGAPAADGGLEADYHDEYADGRSYDQSFGKFFDADYTVALIRAVWGWSPPYRLIDCGSASGLTLAQLESLGVEAWGIENSAHVHAQTSPEWRDRNLLGDVRALPFPDNSFDFVYETCLCHVPEQDIDRAIREIFRVCRVGVLFGSTATDMTREVIEDYQLFYGVRTFRTLWQWSEAFLQNGFRPAVISPKILDRVWQIEQETDEDDWNWYPDKESMRFIFFSKPGAQPRGAARRAPNADPDRLESPATLSVKPPERGETLPSGLTRGSRAKRAGGGQ
jgi:monoamine oxidase/SAM-dependent methyltransferase